MAGPLIEDIEKASKDGEEVTLVARTRGGGRLHLRFTLPAAAKLLEASAPWATDATPGQMSESLAVKAVQTGVQATGEPFLMFETVGGRKVHIPLGLGGLDELRRQLKELHTKLQSLTTKH